MGIRTFSDLRRYSSLRTTSLLVCNLVCRINDLNFMNSESGSLRSKLLWTISKFPPCCKLINEDMYPSSLSLVSCKSLNEVSNDTTVLWWTFYIRESTHHRLLNQETSAPEFVFDIHLRISKPYRTKTPPCPTQKISLWLSAEREHLMRWISI